MRIKILKTVLVLGLKKVKTFYSCDKLRNDILQYAVQNQIQVTFF